MRKLNKVAYIGLFLDENSRNNLLQKCKTFSKNKSLHPKEVAHHVTLAFKKDPDIERVYQWTEQNLGKQFTITVDGLAEDDNCQAVKVSLPGDVICLRDNPHITISLAGETSPVYSNELLQSGYVRFPEGFTVTGTLDTFPSSLTEKE